MSSNPDWTPPKRYVPGPGMPSLPPQLTEFSDYSPDQIVKELKRLPFFMTDLEADEGEDNVEIEALKALAYDGEPDEIATNFKEQGNDCYRQKNYKDAIEFYTKALDVKCEVDEINVACYVNRAACNLELKNYRRCIGDCKLALKISPKNVKALFRSSKAYLAVDRVDEALACADYALSIDPDNAALKSLKTSAETRRDRLAELEQKRKKAIELKETKKRNLEVALQSRNITLINTAIGGAGNDDQQRSMHQDLKISLRDELNPGSDLSVPLLFLYPLEMESDIFQQSDLEAPINFFLSQLFENPPPWFSKSSSHQTDYQLSNLEVFVQTISGGLAKVGKKSSIIKVLSMKSPVIPVMDGVARFFVVPKNRAEEWTSSWNKQQAQQLMQGE
ncbi:Cns1p [Sugiyamaella lignohabitans]|uniref:Cns1p n=1 Tax=Sugiyamaella lignohabitans TaxID=796027 RepID=A0A161HJC1_9ASCO|nr:Cns1p [Sugiyamaella lignohabitans]ANB12807.1 Cns1p [Sugiyamaella lignohabitans]